MTIVRTHAIRFLLSAAAAFTLAACDSREPIHFGTDPRILRGLWLGEASRTALLVSYGVPVAAPGAPIPLRLELEADYGTEEEYSFDGTFSFGESRYRIEGSVSGGHYHRYLQLQTPPPMPATVTGRVLDDGGREIFRFQGIGPMATPHVWGTLIEGNGTEAFTFELARSSAVQ